MGVFNEEDQTLFQMEGKINDAVELMVLADERYVPIRLMGVEDIKYTSEVNGVSVRHKLYVFTMDPSISSSAYLAV